MTIDEAIEKHKKLKIRAESTNDKRGAFYSAEEHEQLSEWLEELKAIKEMDLSFPQHFAKEQSDWIKAYCIKRNIEFYNKAVDDFIHECDKYCGYYKGENKNLTRECMLMIAEKLKAGVAMNEKSILRTLIIPMWYKLH